MQKGLKVKQINHWLRELLLHPPISAWWIRSTGNTDRIGGLQNNACII